jgi:acetyltransferase-like isoleucine patch superfamily enzyme
LTGPPRILHYSQDFNLKILRAFGAQIGQRSVRIHSPITLHEAENGYHNLIIHDGCIINGNNFLDLSEKIILEKGVSLGPGVIIMTHNSYNRNEYLIKELQHTCGKKSVLIKEGSGIKAGAVIVMGVTIGCNAVVAANAVVNRDVEDYSMVAGIPAKVIKTFDKPLL